jgi:hypothetical protein
MDFRMLITYSRKTESRRGGLKRESFPDKGLRTQYVYYFVTNLRPPKKTFSPNEQLQLYTVSVVNRNIVVHQTSFHL